MSARVPLPMVRTLVLSVKPTFVTPSLVLTVMELASAASILPLTLTAAGFCARAGTASTAVSAAAVRTCDNFMFFFLPKFTRRDDTTARVGCEGRPTDEPVTIALRAWHL